MDINVSSLLLAIPIFFLAYQGMDLYMESRKSRSWNTRRGGHGETVVRKSIGARLPFNQVFLAKPKFRERLEMQLLRTGNPYGWTPADLLFYQETAGVLAVLFLWLGEITSPWMALIGFPVGFYAVDLWMRSRIATRQAEIQRNLPGFVDLLALTIESGLDFIAAVERIIEKMKPNALRAELQTLIQENRLGTARKEALQHLGARTDLSDVQALASMITQSEELGTSLATVLRTYAEDMRSKRILRAEELAGKAPVKILMPMVVFFFPIVFVIIFGPVAATFLNGH